METGKQIWVQTGINFNRMQGPIISYNEISVGVYKISMSKQGFYLEYVMSEFVFDYKIYGQKFNGDTIIGIDYYNHVVVCSDCYTLYFYKVLNANDGPNRNPGLMNYIF